MAIIAKAGVWRSGEEGLEGATIVGRATIEVVGGKVAHGFEIEVRGERFAVWWDRTEDGVGKFVTLPITEEQ